jgi:septal ring factor EnvC (AmiA/AmiB activator)
MNKTRTERTNIRSQNKSIASQQEDIETLKKRIASQQEEIETLRQDSQMISQRPTEDSRPLSIVLPETINDCVRVPGEEGPTSSNFLTQLLLAKRAKVISHRPTILPCNESIRQESRLVNIDWPKNAKTIPRNVTLPEAERVKGVKREVL